MLHSRTFAIVVLLTIILAACLFLRQTAEAPAQILDDMDSIVVSTSTEIVNITEPTPLPTSTPPVIVEPEDLRPEPILPPVLPPAKDCFVSGCSSQLCTDRTDLATTCEWQDSYACYRTATCERQPSGQCGWTETPELRQCLSTSGPSI